MESIRALVIYLLIFSCGLFSTVICDGDHAHEHDHAAADSGAAASSDSAPADLPPPSSPSRVSTGTVSAIHTTTAGGGGGRQDSFSSILSNISPDVIRNFASNPAIAQYLKSSGIDVGAAAAAGAAKEAGGAVPPPPSTSYGLPDAYGSPYGGGFGGPGGFGGGFGGGIPFLGPYAGLSVGGDYGIGGPYIVKKVIIFVGGGILLLVLLALLSKGFATGGLFNQWGSSISEAFAGSAAVDVGPFHKSVAGSQSAAVGVGNQQIGSRPQDIRLNQRVQNGLDQRF